MIKTAGFFSMLWIVSACCKVMAWDVFLRLYILSLHEKHAEKHQLLYTYTYEVQLHLRGTAMPMATATSTRYSFTYEVQLHLHVMGTATTTRYNYSYVVKLHLQELVCTFKSTLKKICWQLLNYLQFFLFNYKNRLMLIKRLVLIIQQNHSNTTLTESETNRLILL